MEQNEINTQNTLSAAQPDVNESGAIPTTPAEPVPVVPEPEMATSVPVESKVNNRNNKKQLVVLALVLCLLLAIGGIGFGIWAMMDSNKKDGEISSLRSQNADLSEQVANLNAEVEELSEVKEVLVPTSWASTELIDGNFCVLGDDGQVIVRSDIAGLVVNEITACESSAEDTILTCTVNTSEGEGWFLYDAYSSSLTSSF